MSAHEEKRIVLRGKHVSYKVRRDRRARGLRISIRHDGKVTVTVPIGVPTMIAEVFLRYKSRWVVSQLAAIKKAPQKCSPKATRERYLKHKEEARRFVMERLVHFNKVYGFTYKRVSIRDQKTRWGSCSKSGNLNFNYRIVLLPPHLADYIIVHELCHLKELNHSRRFWDLVARVLPNYRSLRKELREKGKQIV